MISEESQQVQTKEKPKACAFRSEMCDLFVGKQQKLKKKTPKQEAVEMTRRTPDKETQTRWGDSHASQGILYSNRTFCIK